MARFKPKYEDGERVETLPHTDAWASGDRYGTVVNETIDRVYLRMEVSRKLRSFRQDSVRPTVPPLMR